MDNSVFYNLLNRVNVAYVLTMSHRIDRHQHIKNELIKIGGDLSTLNKYINFYYGTTFPYNDIIIDAFNKSGKGRFTKPNEYDCARNHYNMIKIAYDLGYNNILIMEDDILFLNDLEYISKTLDNIPDDYDILQFGGFTTDPRILDVIDSSEYWYKNTSIGVWNCSMYMLSRKGMEYYIAFMNKIFWVADGPIYMAHRNSNIINSYISTKPIVIQQDKSIMYSDIRNNENDTINYNTDNLYESKINRIDYN